MSNAKSEAADALEELRAQRASGSFSAVVRYIAAIRGSVHDDMVSAPAADLPALQYTVRILDKMHKDIVSLRDNARADIARDGGYTE